LLKKQLKNFAKSVDKYTHWVYNENIERRWKDEQEKKKVRQHLVTTSIDRLSNWYHSSITWQVTRLNEGGA